ncbi:MAG TPA: acetamidase/formamidase family protein [Beijerinckiaceae bacterium]
MIHHRLDAAPDTVHWGTFDARIAPVLTVSSGDQVTISTVSGGPDVLPNGPFEIPPALPAIHQALRPVLPGHICTGPIHVREAKAGQVLEVRIKSVELHYDWGYTRSGPQKGALPDDFERDELLHITLDRSQMTGRLPWGDELELRPFFGVMGVAPPASWGAVSTLPPRRNGGNLDNKELIAGTTLYLPVHVDGALFSVGDGHGVQGDGEVCVTAIETGLIGTFEFILREDMHLTWPRAETPTHVMTMAFDADLDACVTLALRQMLELVASRTALTRQQAYALCSLAADVRITQVVNGNKGVHVMLPKRHLPPSGGLALCPQPR